MRRPSSSALFLTAVLLSAAACGDDPAGPPAVDALEAEAAVLAGTVAEAVPVGIKVLDAAGRPIRGIDVMLAVSGGGSLDADTVPTGSDGVARASWTLGIRAGEQRLTAQAQGHTAHISADARPGPARSLVGLGALQREGTVGSQGDPLAVRALDAWDNPVPGQAVAFATTAGRLAATSVATGGDGTAMTHVTFPTATGDFVVTASVGGARVEFPHAALPAAPALLRATAGEGQSGEVGSALPVPVRVVLTDEHDNPVPGRTLTFEAAEGGSVSAATVQTDPEGAAVATWTLGPAAGTQTLRARFGSLPELAIEALASAGPASTASAAAGDGQGAQQGTELDAPVVVRVEDRFGNPVGGAPVEWRVAVGGGALVSAHGTTGADGLASARWRLGAAGPQRLDATAQGLGAVAFTATAYDGMTITVDSLAGARRGWAYEARLTATGGGLTWSLAGGTLPAGLSLGADGVLAGVPAQEGVFPLVVRARDAGGAQDDADLSLRVCGDALTLEPGETAQVVWPEACGALLPPAGGAAYRIGVMARAYRTSGYQASDVGGGLLLRSRVGTPGQAFGLTAPQVPPARPVEEALDPEIRALQEATERLHHQLREEERRRFPRVAATPLGPPLPAAMARVQTPLTRSFFVRGNTVSATLRDSSAHVLYYQDDGVIAENSRATDAEVRALLEYYDAYGDSIVRDVFGGLGPPGTTRNFKDDAGNVLELPAADLDRNGRIIVLQIRPSYMPSGAAAYVTSCDRFPRLEHVAAGYYCASSNEGEITYYNRPSSDFYLGSLVHEAKHISSHGWAIFGGRGYNPSWIEEGTAEIAKEKSSRAASGVRDGAQVDRAGIYPSGSLTRATYGMGVVHSRARAFLKAAPLSGIIGNPSPNPSGSTYYGSSWLLHRWLADAFADGDEAAFFRAMNTGGTGIAAIQDATGRTFSELLAGFMTALAVEGSGAARAAAPLRFRSYDFADIATVASGTWPYALGTGAFRTGDVSLPTYYSAPSFFEFEAAGGDPLRLDALTGEGLDTRADDEVVLTITRIR